MPDTIKNLMPFNCHCVPFIEEKIINISGKSKEMFVPFLETEKLHGSFMGNSFMFALLQLLTIITCTVIYFK